MEKLIMNKEERRLLGKKKTDRLRFLYDHNKIFWFTGEFREGGYFHPVSQAKAKKTLKKVSNKCIRRKERAELEKSTTKSEEYSDQIKGNRHKRKFDYDWTLD